MNSNVVGAFTHYNGRVCCWDTEHRWQSEAASGFKDPAWHYEAPLRQAFYKELRGERMQEVLDQAYHEFDGCFGGYITCEVLEADLNAKFCPVLNSELLNPAGYLCKAVAWRAGQNQEWEFCAIVIENAPQPTASAPPGAAPSGPGAVQ